nr:ribulose bisphosphate carboxylase small subunit [Rivularia sp. PCC 7116]
MVEEYNRGALRHQKHFVPQAAPTPVYEARPTSHFDANLPTYQARPTANFDGEPLPTYHARPSYQAQAEAVHIPDIPATTSGTASNRSLGQNPNRLNQNTPAASTHVGPEILSYMQKILASGNHLSIEYASKDKFGKGDWQRFSTHEIDDMADAIGDLERCLVKHTDDYVRVAGIDYKTKKAVMGTIIQDPNEVGGSTFHYPPTQEIYPTKQIQGDSTFHYPETVTPKKQLGGSTFHYPEKTTPNYSKQSSDSTFHYPETTTPNYSEQSSDSTFHYPETTTPNYSEQSSDSTFHYPETTTPNYSEQSSDSTFHYPEIVTPKKQLGGSTFHYPEPSTPNTQIGGSSFRYPAQSKTYNNPQSSDSTFVYPESDPFPHPHTAAHSYTATSNPHQAVENSHTYRTANPNNTQISSAHLELEVLEQMREILASGNHIGIEYVDQRRFRTGSWNSYAGHQIEDMAEAIAAVEACLVEHNNDYIRIFGIDPKAKRRLTEIMIQRPGGKLVVK